VPLKEPHKTIAVPLAIVDRLEQRHRWMHEAYFEIIERALDVEDLVRAGVFGDPFCYLCSPMARFPSPDELLAHVRTTHSGILPAHVPAAPRTGAAVRPRPSPKKRAAIS
jgi:hypothetical protein